MSIDMNNHEEHIAAYIYLIITSMTSNDLQMINYMQMKWLCTELYRVKRMSMLNLYIAS